MYNLNFKIIGITCEACIRLIKKHLSRNLDIHDISIAMDGTASACSKNMVTLDDLRSALSGTPYKLNI